MLQALRDSCLVEAFNLKLAIELQLKDSQLAQEALADMPQRPEADWDPVGSPPSRSSCTMSNSPVQCLDHAHLFRVLGLSCGAHAAEP